MTSHSDGSNTDNASGERVLDASIGSQHPGVTNLSVPTQPAQRIVPETTAEVTQATPEGKVPVGLVARLRQRVFGVPGPENAAKPHSDVRILPPIDDVEDEPEEHDLTRETAKWNRRRDIPIAVLAWAGVLYLALIVAQHIVTTLLLLVMAAILAFALVPAVTFLERWLPRIISILIVYLLVLGGLGTLIYLVAITAVDQVNSAVTYLSSHNLSSYLNLLTPLGITKVQLQQQFQNVQGQLVGQAKTAASSAVPLLAGFFDALLNIVLVAVLSIYFLIDGARITSWLRKNAPHSVRRQTRVTLDTVNRVVGGYIRGQLFLCVIIGLFVGVGMTILHVPYALLLGVLAFFLEFIPILGTLVSGSICVLLGFTQGLWIGLAVLAYFIIVHVLEGDVIGPRVVGKAIGLHPIVSIAALIAGSELFGVWGALFASPVAGVVQALLIVIWLNWREQHPHEFQTGTEKTLDTAAQEFVAQSQKRNNQATDVQS